MKGTGGNTVLKPANRIRDRQDFWSDSLSHMVLEKEFSRNVLCVQEGKGRKPDDKSHLESGTDRTEVGRLSRSGPETVTRVVSWWLLPRRWFMRKKRGGGWLI